MRCDISFQAGVAALVARALFGTGSMANTRRAVSENRIYRRVLRYFVQYFHPGANCCVVVVAPRRMLCELAKALQANREGRV